MNQTPLQKAMAEFQRLKDAAKSLRDIVYLDGVMAVLESIKEYEKEQIKAAYQAGSEDMDDREILSQQEHQQSAEEYFKNIYH